MVFYAVWHRLVSILEIINTLKDERVGLLSAKNSAGHTCEYAQHDNPYQLFAFHECKSTKYFWSRKLLA